MMAIGVISDTHGLLRPEAMLALEGCSTIIHAGDVGTPDILDQLRTHFKEVVAVRGNADQGAWADALPTEVKVDFEGRVLQVTHGHLSQYLDCVSCDAIISGHTHKRGVSQVDGVLRLNPGVAGLRAFQWQPISVARLEVIGGILVAKLIVLKVAS